MTTHRYGCPSCNAPTRSPFVLCDDCYVAGQGDFDEYGFPADSTGVDCAERYEGPEE